MNAIIYNITHTEVPRLVKNFHEKVSLGYAYELDSHFVHFYASLHEWFVIHTGLTVLEEKNGSLIDRVKKYFGATNIATLKSDVGVSFEGVWRPGLYYASHISQALNISEHNKRLTEQPVRILIEKLDELFLYIEPDNNSLNTYSHKTRELLILACTEVENFWTEYLVKSNTAPINQKNYTTKDYVKLLDLLFLNEYECHLRSYETIASIKPFVGWTSTSPTISLPWYDAYNKTKHHKSKHFSDATFNHVLHAVVATIILYIVRYGPFPLVEDTGAFSSLINQHFKFNLLNPNLDYVYVPLVSIPQNCRKDIFCYDSKENENLAAFIVKPLII